MYSLYKSGHNQCKKRSLGTYKLDIGSFVRAYTRQMQNEYEAKGQDYEVDEESMNYLQCQQYYYNNNLVSNRWICALLYSIHVRIYLFQNDMIHAFDTISCLLNFVTFILSPTCFIWQCIDNPSISYKTMTVLHESRM